MTHVILIGGSSGLTRAIAEALVEALVGPAIAAREIIPDVLDVDSFLRLYRDIDYHLLAPFVYVEYLLVKISQPQTKVEMLARFSRGRKLTLI